MFAAEQCDRRQKLDVDANWHGRLDDRDRYEYGMLARAALEAAAPQMMARAWDEGIESGVDGSVPPCDYARNPYAHS
jgi:hypothetical protein